MSSTLLGRLPGHVILLVGVLVTGATLFVFLAGPARSGITSTSTAVTALALCYGLGSAYIGARVVVNA